MNMASNRENASFENYENTRERAAQVLPAPPALGSAADGDDLGLDDLLDDVAEALGMPLVLVGHVNQETYTLVAFHARVGQAGLAHGDTIPIGETYCREEITADKPFFMGDAELHPRFSQHPGFRKHGFRAYVGAPLVLTDGTLFGTLCGVDTEPNWVSLAGVERLVALAAELSDRISRRLGLTGTRAGDAIAGPAR